ncbi:tetratricopeptide repeat protein [Maioricimonas rarisocia]|nr:tetratricopeptide repeat protein [Maioricimonas rarisocia]
MASLFLEDARNAHEAGDTERHLRSLRRYVATARGDLDAREELVCLMHDRAATLNERFHVWNEMEQILRLDSSRHDIRRRAADLLIEFGMVRPALAHFEFLIHEEQDDWEVYTLIGFCREQLGKREDLEAAADAYRKAIDLAPEHYENYVAFALVLEKLPERGAVADALLREFMESDGGAPMAHLAHARLQLQSGDIVGAVGHAKSAYELDAFNVDAILLIAELIDTLPRSANPFRDQVDLSMIRQQLESSLEQLNRTGDSTTRTETRYAQIATGLATLDVEFGELDAAEHRLRAALQRFPENQRLVWALANIVVSQSDIEATQTAIAQLQELEIGEELITYLNGMLAVTQQDWHAAATRFESIRIDQLPTASIRSQVCAELADCYRNMGDQRRRLAILQSALKWNNGSPKLMLALAETLLSENRVSEAVSLLEQQVKLPGVALVLAKILVNRNLLVPHSRREWNAPTRLLGQAATSEPGRHEEIAILRAEIATHQGQPQQALAFLQQEAAEKPASLALQIAIAEARDATGDPAGALKTLQAAEAEFGWSRPLFQASVRHWIRIAGDDGRRGLAALEDRLVELPEEDSDAELLSLARGYEQLGDFDKALDFARRTADRSPWKLQVWNDTCKLAIQAGDLDEATLCVANMRRYESNGGYYWKLAQARVHIERVRRGETESSAKAKKLLGEAANLEEGDPEPYRLLGRLADIEDRDNAAIRHFQAAVNRGERTPHVYQRLVELLVPRRRYQDAENVVQWFLENQPAIEKPFAMLAVEVFLRNGSHVRAEELARSVLRSSPSDYATLVWYGHAMARTGRPRIAEAAFRRAIGINHGQPHAWHSLLQLLTRENRLTAATDVLTDIVRMVPEDLRSLILGRGYELVGDVPTATHHFDDAVARDGTNPDVLTASAGFHIRHGNRTQASAQLERLLDPELRAPEWTVANARRTLALLIASHDGYAGLQRAEELLRMNREEFGESRDDALMRARLLAASPSLGKRQEAIALLEQLADYQPLAPDDRFLHARICTSNGESSRARESLEILIEDDPDNADFLAAAVHNALRFRFSPQRASRLWQSLYRVEPDSFRTLALHVRLLLLQGDLTRAMQVLTDHVEAGTGDEKLLRGREVARLLNAANTELELGGRTTLADEFAPYAEALLRQHAEREPGGRIALARFLGRRMRTSEALAECEAVWDVLPAEVVAGASLELLQTLDADAEDVRRFRSRFEELAAADPGSTTRLFLLGGYLNLAGDYDAAIATYRATIEAAEQASSACNELALLLALTERDASEALDWINRAIESAGPSAILLDTRATVHLALSDPRSAIADLETAIADAPTPVRVFHLAQARLALDDRDGARAALRSAFRAGLQVLDLHPLERDHYHEIVDLLQLSSRRRPPRSALRSPGSR